MKSNITDVNKLARLDYVKECFKAKGIMFIEKMNGHLAIDGINFWATTEKWYDPFTNTKGKGINSFLNHLKEERITNE